MKIKNILYATCAASLFFIGNAVSMDKRYLQKNPGDAIFLKLKEIEDSDSDKKVEVENKLFLEIKDYLKNNQKDEHYVTQTLSTLMLLDNSLAQRVMSDTEILQNIENQEVINNLIRVACETESWSSMLLLLNHIKNSDIFHASIVDNLTNSLQQVSSNGSQELLEHHNTEAPQLETLGATFFLTTLIINQVRDGTYIANKENSAVHEKNLELINELQSFFANNLDHLAFVIDVAMKQNHKLMVQYLIFGNRGYILNSKPHLQWLWESAKELDNEAARELKEDIRGYLLY